MGCCDEKDGGEARKQDLREVVRSAYGKIASEAGSCCGPPSCCGPQTDADTLAQKIGYSETELASLPDGANMGLSCGNPTALAALREGEVVVDLGSGGGFDVFLAAQKVGKSGLAIGVDMTPEMLSTARRNVATFTERTELTNVEFRLGEIENLPLADASVDVILSNCVINLSPEKQKVWNDVARVLKPGGRVAVSDLALLKPIPEALRQSVEALVGCVAGAVLVEDTRRMLVEAGFVDIELLSRIEIIDSMADWSDPLYNSLEGLLKPGEKMSDYVTSLEIAATKPVHEGE
ncbi:MAG: arsenite methyltransferase [Planctomycetota bacterium]|jgi:ubiquinone/menaquinone biosynthesis C-methylase UbiE